jgi:nucleoside-triphosphatase THEP1
LPPVLFRVTIAGMQDVPIILLTGERQIGKTTALSSAVELLRGAGVTVTGLLTRRAGPHDLVVAELHTGSSYPLTDPYHEASSSQTANFVMNEAAFARSSSALMTSFPTQVFVLDEIGPLELRHRRGWVGGLDLLKREAYTLAIIVVRPELLGQAISELPGMRFTVMRVDRENRQGLDVALFDTVMAALSRAACHGEVA